MSTSVELTYCIPTIRQGMRTTVSVDGWTTGKTVSIIAATPEESSTPEDAITAFDTDEVDGKVPPPATPIGLSTFTMNATRKDDQSASIGTSNSTVPLILYTKETIGMTDSYGAGYVVNAPEIYFTAKDLGQFPSFVVAQGETVPVCGINLSLDGRLTSRMFLKSVDTGDLTELYVRNAGTSGMTIVEQYRDRFAMVNFTPKSGEGSIEPGEYVLYVVLEIPKGTGNPSKYTKYGVFRSIPITVCEDYEQFAVVGNVSANNVTRGECYTGGMDPKNTGKQNARALIAAILNAWDEMVAASSEWNYENLCSGLPFVFVNILPGSYKLDRRIPVPPQVGIRSTGGEVKFVVDDTDFGYEAYETSFHYDIPTALTTLFEAGSDTGFDTVFWLTSINIFKNITIEIGNGEVFPKGVYPKSCIAIDSEILNAGPTTIQDVKILDSRYQDTISGHLAESVGIELGTGTFAVTLSNIEIHTNSVAIAYEPNAYVQGCFFDRVRVYGSSSARGQFGRCIVPYSLFYQCQWETIERGPISQGGLMPKEKIFFVECDARHCGQNYEGAESILFETSYAQYLETVSAATSDSVTVPDPPSNDFVAGGRYIWITSGTGRGQFRRIEGSSSSSGSTTISVDRPWRIQPDSTSVITASPAVYQLNVLGCRATSQRMLAAIYQPSIESVFAGNKTRDCDLGAYFYGRDSGVYNQDNELIRSGAEVHIGILIMQNEWVNTPRAILLWIARSPDKTEPLYFSTTFFANRFANSSFCVSHNLGVTVRSTIVGINFARDSWDAGLDMANEIPGYGNPNFQLTTLPRTLSLLPIGLLQNSFQFAEITADSVVNGYTKTSYGNAEQFWGPETSGEPIGFPIPGLDDSDPQVSPGHLT